jgi:hypothetical protein
MTNGAQSHRSRHGWLSGALAATFMLLGTTTAGASSGTLVKEPQYGFSFRLPSGWKEVPLDGSDVKSLLSNATHDDPSLSNALDSQIVSESAKGMKVFGIGPLTNSSTPDVDVIVISAAGTPSGRAFASEGVTEAKIEYAQIGAVHYKASVVTDRLGDAAKGTYELKGKTLGTQYGTQYFVRHKASVYIVTVTTPSAASTQTAGNLIVNSWRW